MTSHELELIEHMAQRVVLGLNMLLWPPLDRIIFVEHAQTPAPQYTHPAAPPAPLPGCLSMHAGPFTLRATLAAMHAWADPGL